MAGLFFLSGLNGIDRPLWLQSPLFLLRLSFDHLLFVSLGIAMVVLVLEGARARTDELNDKLRQLSLLTAAGTQTLSVREMLDRVLVNLVGSLGVSHGIVRLLEGDGASATLVVHAAVGFGDHYLSAYNEIPASEPWAQRVLKEEYSSMKIADERDERERKRMAATGVTEEISLVLRGKDTPLGILAVGCSHAAKFQDDEIDYLRNIANLLGLTLQNVLLFEQVDKVQRQWAYTFDSIGDPILVHDKEGRVLRVEPATLAADRAGKISHGSAAQSVSSFRESRANSRSAHIAKVLPAKETIPIRGFRDIFWPPIRFLPTPPGGSWGSSTSSRTFPTVSAPKKNIAPWFPTFKKACSFLPRRAGFWTLMTLFCAFRAMPRAMNL